jgi:hypothetical protein
VTTLHYFDISRIFEVIRDRPALELVQRVVQSEVTFHESRLAQLKQLDQAIGKRLQEMK